MPDKDTVFEKLYKEVEQIFAQTPTCHDFEHTLRVLNNAWKLHQCLPQSDWDQIRFGALLHDIGRPGEHEGKSDLNHAQIGAEMINDILGKYDLNPQFIEQIELIVRRHRYRDNCHPETIEEKIVYDADKLDSLGAVGVARAFLFAGKIGSRLHNRIEEAVNSKSYSIEDTAFREYYLKLRHLPEKMQTIAAQNEGKKRLIVMEAFFSELNKEIYDK